MSADVLQTAKDVLLVLGTVGGTWYGARLAGRKNKTDAAQSLFNEVQEERAELKRDNADLKKKVGDLEVAVGQMRHRELEVFEFIQELRNHIRLNLGPPPPEWPEGLRHG